MLPCRAHLDKLLEYVEISIKEGARLAYGGKRVDRPGKGLRTIRSLLCSGSCDTGFFMEPTILADVEDHMMAAEEESFGPIMVISPFETGYVHVMKKLLLSHCSFSDIDGVIRRANATEYGLASGVFTRDINKVSCDHVTDCSLLFFYRRSTLVTTLTLVQYLLIRITKLT